MTRRLKINWRSSLSTLFTGEWKTFGSFAPHITWFFMQIRALEFGTHMLNSILAWNTEKSKTKSGYECLFIYRSKYMLITMHIILKWDSPKVFLISPKLHLLASFVCFALFLSKIVGSALLIFSATRACELIGGGNVASNVATRRWLASATSRSGSTDDRRFRVDIFHTFFPT